MYAAPFLHVMGHFFGSRVSVPSGHTVSGRPDVTMEMDSSSMALACPEWRLTGCIPTVLRPQPTMGQCDISALAMKRGRRPWSNRPIMGMNTSYSVICVHAVMKGPVSGTFSRPHA